ncbi:MAG TPA: DUF2442 domain-containing protein [Rhizomicrobium sp.]
MINHIAEIIADVAITDTTLAVTLRDGRKISAPLDWFPKLKNASQSDREAWELSAAGHGIHWSRIDEDLGLEGLLHRQPAPNA